MPGFSPTCCEAGARELIALAFDEIGEVVVGVEPCADHQTRHPPRHRGGDGGGNGGRGFLACPRANLHGDDRCAARGGSAQQFADSSQQIGVDPVDDEAVGRQQFEHAFALDGLQRAHPGVELLLR